MNTNTITACMAISALAIALYAATRSVGSDPQPSVTSNTIRIAGPRCLDVNSRMEGNDKAARGQVYSLTAAFIGMLDAQARDIGQVEVVERPDSPVLVSLIQATLALCTMHPHRSLFQETHTAYDVAASVIDMSDGDLN
jgi:hypothetical protein